MTITFLEAVSKFILAGVIARNVVCDEAIPGVKKGKNLISALESGDCFVGLRPPRNDNTFRRFLKPLLVNQFPTT